MSDPRAQRLQATLASIVQDERLDVTDIMRAGDLARNSIDGILKGQHAEPRRETLHKLARGCATDPRTGVLDIPTMANYEALLNAAAGYGDLTAQQAQTMIELGLYYYLQDMPRAQAVAAYIERIRDLSLAEIQALRPPE